LSSLEFQKIKLRISSLKKGIDKSSFSEVLKKFKDFQGHTDIGEWMLIQEKISEAYDYISIPFDEHKRKTITRLIDEALVILKNNEDVISKK
jgi:hypothetical protein